MTTKNVDPVFYKLKRHIEEMLKALAHAQMDGKRRGREHQGDPWRLAKAIGARVEDGDRAKMRAKGRIGMCIRPPGGGEGGLIWLADGLRPHERPEVLRA